MDLIRGWRLAIALLLVPVAGTTLAYDIALRGLSGAWHAPTVAGQGIHLEIHPDAVAPGLGFVHGSWATFSEYVEPWDDAGPRWFTFGGVVAAGQARATFPVYENMGGRFNAPVATSIQEVGKVELSVVDCSAVDMKYTFYRFSPPGDTIRLIRLMPDVACVSEASGAGSWNYGSLESAMPGFDDWPYSGNWYDPATPGQGFALEVNPRAAVVFMTWYTYGRDDDARQRWYTGQASYTLGSRTLSVTLFETQMSWLPTGKLAHTTPVGTATIAFRSCHAAHLTFSFTGGTHEGASGTIGLSRVGPTPADCR